MKKTFRDRGYRILWDNSTQTRHESDKASFEVKCRQIKRINPR